MAIKPDKRAITNEQAAVMPCWKHTIVSIATQQLSKHCSTTSPNMASNSHCPHAAGQHSLLTHFLPNTRVLEASPHPEDSSTCLRAWEVGWLQSSSGSAVCCNLSPRNRRRSSPSAPQNPSSRRDLIQLHSKRKHQRPLLAARCHRGWPLSQGSADKQSQSELTYDMWRWKAQRRLTGSCPILRPADSLPVLLLRPMSPQAAGAMPREISVLSPPPPQTTQDLTTFQERQKEKGSSK